MYQAEKRPSRSPSLSWCCDPDRVLPEHHLHIGWDPLHSPPPRQRSKLLPHLLETSECFNRDGGTSPRLISKETPASQDILLAGTTIPERGDKFATVPPIPRRAFDFVSPQRLAVEEHEGNERSQSRRAQPLFDDETSHASVAGAPCPRRKVDIFNF